MRNSLKPALVALTLAAGACTTVSSGETDAQIAQNMVETITGQLAYRERIALPPEARMEIVITDITRGEDDGLVLSRLETSIGNASVPIPFAIDVSKHNLSEGPLYVLRAFLKDADGTVLFRSTEPFLLNLRNEQIDVGTIMLSMTTPDDQGARDVAQINDGEWRVTQFNFDVVPVPTAPVMTFALDGRFYGSTGCNNFSSDYTLDGTQISISPIATTMRACEAPLMEQERRFLEVISSVNRVSLDEDGRLLLEGTNGLRMNAERNR